MSVVCTNTEFHEDVSVSETRSWRTYILGYYTSRKWWFLYVSPCMLLKYWCYCGVYGQAISRARIKETTRIFVWKPPVAVMGWWHRELYWLFRAGVSGPLHSAKYRDLNGLIIALHVTGPRLHWPLYLALPRFLGVFRRQRVEIRSSGGRLCRIWYLSSRNLGLCYQNFSES